MSPWTLRETTLSSLDTNTPTGAPLASLVPGGRIVELGAAVAGGRLSLASRFVRAAQHDGEPCAWVQPEGAGLFPPDLAAAGVALDALVVVHTPRNGAGAAVARAGELLLRAGGFGLVVLDLTQGTPRGEAWITRLGALTRREGTRAVLLTTKSNDAPSAGALVAVRIDVRARIESGRYVIDPTVLRDRCHLASRVGSEPCLLPWETPLP